MFTVGVAGPADGGLRLGAALRRAGRTARLLIGLGRRGAVAHSDALGPLGRLAAHAPPVEIADVLDEVLAPLAQVDTERRERLITTLSAWFDHDGSVRRAARALGVHVNTIYSRIDRLDELFGSQWRGACRLEVETAVRLDLLGRDLGRSSSRGPLQFRLDQRTAHDAALREQAVGRCDVLEREAARDQCARIEQSVGHHPTQLC